MLGKKDKRGKCPFNKFKICQVDCMFYRKGFRYTKKGEDPVEVENCAINIITDNIEVIHQRIFNLQQELGETKNATLFQAVASLTEDEGSKMALGRMIQAAGGVSNLLDNKEK